MFKTRTRARLLPIVCVLSLALLATACGGGDDDNNATPEPFDQATAQAFLATYSDIIHANYCDILVLCQDLEASIDSFVGAPDAMKLQECKDKWIAARLIYQQNEITRFYDGPIDDADGPEGLMNAWPMDESHVDYVSDGMGGVLVTGIINNAGMFPTINKQTLIDNNETPNEDSISTGWHAIEFLLWGQDDVDPNNDNGAGGMRSHLDYVDGMAPAGLPAGNEARRRDYLVCCIDLLITNITDLKNEWAPNGAYRQQLLGLPVAEALGKVMTGIGSLLVGELRGERIVVGFDSKLQEDEHSCFSDTSHNDHRQDIVGAINVWTGSYTSSDGNNDVNGGTGLMDLAMTAPDPSMATTINTQLTDCLALSSVAAISPWDVAVLGPTLPPTTPGREAIQALIDCLAQFNLSYSDLIEAFGVTATTQLQD